MVDRVQTDAIYTDLSAAFDKLDHNIAIAKLDRFGICGNFLRWFRSYLTDRQLKVVIGDCSSDSFHATSGIPQGSHLGPVIFLLYFNDVHYVLKAPRLSYADDLKLFLRIRSTADCLYLQQQLDLFASWCSLNGMVVNPTKCSIITFSRKKRSIAFPYSLLGTSLERVDHIKDLGVFLDSQLSFKQHISYTVSKASFDNSRFHLQNRQEFLRCLQPEIALLLSCALHAGIRRCGLEPRLQQWSGKDRICPTKISSIRTSQVTVERSVSPAELRKSLSANRLGPSSL